MNMFLFGPQSNVWNQFFKTMVTDTPALTKVEADQWVERNKVFNSFWNPFLIYNHMLLRKV